MLDEKCLRRYSSHYPAVLNFGLKEKVHIGAEKFYYLSKKVHNIVNYNVNFKKKI